MAKKGTQEINFTSEQIFKGKFSAHRKGMPSVRCACGCEILIVPDLKAMKQAVKNHIAEHEKAGDRSSRIDSLEVLLTEQVLIVVSKLNLSMA